MATDAPLMMSHLGVLNEPELQTGDSDPQQTSDTNSSIMEHKGHDHSARSTKHLGKDSRDTPNYTRLLDILLASAIVFVPMASISLILLGLTFYGGVRAQFPGLEVGRPELPVSFDQLPPGNSFYTTVGQSTFLAVGSWSSTVAEAVITPFTLMFSFFVAQSALRKRKTAQDSEVPSEVPSEEIQAIFKKPYQGSWRWMKSGFHGSGQPSGHRMQSTYLAGFGVLFALSLTLLAIAGDQWLHYTTGYHTFRYYAPIDDPPVLSQDLSVFTNPNASSFVLTSACQNQIALQLPQNVSAAPLPCSITQNTSTYNVAQPQDAYLILLTGVDRTNSSLQYSDFALLESGVDRREASYDQIIDYVDNTDPNNPITHSIFFYLPSAEQEAIVETTRFGIDDVENFGIDYVANTTSVSTQCSFATQACRLPNITDPTASDTSFNYSCSPFFQGNLDETPQQGIEAVRGWNTSFYNVVNGTQQPIPFQARLNPFTFSAVVDLNSYPFSTFKGYDPGDVADGGVNDAGSDHLAFALNCNMTVYDVSFSFIDGNITQFNATLSDPGKAAVIRAPLQAGFGANYLYQQATFATISTGILQDLMANAFSHAGLAGSYAAFQKAVNPEQRYRFDWTVTTVNKAALIFQVTVCMLYAVVGLVIMVIGLHARRNEEVRKYQAQLLPPLAPSPLSWRSLPGKFLRFSDAVINSGVGGIGGDGDGGDSDAQQSGDDDDGREARHHAHREETWRQHARQQQHTHHQHTDQQHAHHQHTDQQHTHHQHPPQQHTPQ